MRNAAARRVDLAFERCAGAERDHRHALGRAEPHDLLHLLGGLRKDHGVRRLVGDPGQRVGVLLAHRARGDEPVAEPCGERGDDGVDRLAVVRALRCPCRRPIPSQPARVVGEPWRLASPRSRIARTDRAAASGRPLHVNTSPGTVWNCILAKPAFVGCIERDRTPANSMLDRLDLEPLFFAPFVSSVMRVEPAWIDYNGHLNMAYYNVLFDRAVDEVFELLGCGVDYVEDAPAFLPSPPRCMCATCASCMPATRCG